MMFPHTKKLICFLSGSLILASLILQTGCEQDLLFNPSDQAMETKPWTRWWWMGNSVTEKGITEHLEAFRMAGLGGVEIVPIYGQKGDEDNFIPYLSDRWIDMLLHTLREANRLGLGVDMTLGSGWPYGGPWINEQYAAKRISPLSDDGELTGQRVKRAAPGSEGLVVDHFSPEAMKHFLQRFDSLMILIQEENLPLRAIFNDSYEVYGADWTTGFGTLFENKKGYPLPENFPASFGSNAEDSLYIWQDYHSTLGDLTLQTAGHTLRGWCLQYGFQYRYQAHGSPANLLDLYGLASIPETECFGSSAFNIPLVEYDPDYSVAQFARPHPLIYKFASSPAHSMGKRLASAETATWLADHFKVSLAQVKPQVDELFVSGINHILYHGIPYSPFEKGFPGRQFYASTNFGPNSALWGYFDDLNAYIRNCQRMLQNTAPDNDILLYYPVFDLWHNQGMDGNIIMQGVHNPEAWLYSTAFGRTAQSLLDMGFTFDYISDTQIDHLANNPADEHKQYKVLLIPPCRFMPLGTVQRLIELRSQGMVVIFLEGLPEELPGYQPEANRDALKILLKDSEFSTPVTTDPASLAKELARHDVLPEMFPETGLDFIRKVHPGGHLYFITNLDSTDFDGYCALAKKFKAAELYDPLTDSRGRIPGGERIRLQLDAGQSVFLITYNKSIEQAPWTYRKVIDQPSPLDEGWKFDINEKIDQYPLESLVSWTRLPFDWIPYYTGKASYTIDFSIPPTANGMDAFILDLGDVRNMATIRLNGKLAGNLWCVPYRISLPAEILEENNTLVLEVQNLDANQVIRLDRAGAAWKNFYDINFVNIRYERFDASAWDPLPSGLLGPVRLIPVALE